MKFDKVCSIDRGLCFNLRDEDGTLWGRISSCFVSSQRGPFSRSYSNGFLSMSAIALNMNCKADTPEELRVRKVIEATDKSCRKRVDADRRFREWVKSENLREKVIQEAQRLRDDWLKYLADKEPA